MRTIDYYYKRRRIAIFALGGRCVRCSSREDLELDHIDPASKEIDLGRQWSHKNFWIEILDKCQLLCHECHAKKSATELSKYKLQQGFQHGTNYAFWKKGCRCEICNVAKREWYDKRNARRRIKK